MGINKEDLRINAVNRFLQLKDSEKQDLDDLVAAASEICGKPIALVTLLDEDKQWFKINKGLNVSSTDRDIAFCNYTIAENKVFIVEDAHKDERFINNPLVTGYPNIRFYAGAPLTTNDGHTIGSLCVIDQVPGSLSDREIKCLETLAQQVMHRMELSNTVQSLKEAAIEMEAQKNELQNLALIQNAFLNSFNDYFILLDKNLNIVAFNHAWKEFAEKVFSKAPRSGDKMIDFITNGVKEDFEALGQAALNGEEIDIERLADIHNMEPFWYRARLAPFSNMEGKITGLSIIMINIEKEKQHEEAIDFQTKTFSEIARLQSHDIRMPLTNILSLINLMNLEECPPLQKEYLNLLQESANRLDKVINEIVFKADKGRSILSQLEKKSI
jgi:PAS domain-containing protein